MNKDFKPIGPLETARENLEEFADSLIRQEMLRAVVDAYMVGKLLDNSDYDTVSSMAEIESVWTAMADELYAKGISA